MIFVYFYHLNSISRIIPLGRGGGEESPRKSGTESCFYITLPSCRLYFCLVVERPLIISQHGPHFVRNMGQCRVMSGYELLRQVETLRCCRHVRDKEDDGADNTADTVVFVTSACRWQKKGTKSDASRRDAIPLCRRHGGGRQEASGAAVHSR